MMEKKEKKCIPKRRVENVCKKSPQNKACKLAKKNQCKPNKVNSKPTSPRINSNAKTQNEK